MDLDIRLVEVFRQAQRGTQTLSDCALSLHVAGLRRHRLPGYDRRSPGPFLALHPPLEVEFDFGPERENWVVLFASRDVRLSSSAGRVAVRPGASEPWAELPFLVDLRADEVPGLQHEFMLLRESYRSALAGDRLRLHAGVVALIARFLGGVAGTATRDPAARLKRLLDDDLPARHGLAALSRRCGLSPDHLRQRFHRAYGLTPHAYRQRQRLIEAVRLLHTTDLPVREVTARLGFRNASHFCAVFRTHLGQTPAASRGRFHAGP